LEICINRL